ncbi:MAG: 2Fe-2S iron-sulfur cluster-binding protein, partial [Candidatus Adiutrix sp.]
MSVVTINKQRYQLPSQQNLLEYLRETLSLTSAKNGCGEGACGACMVIVDGQAKRACLLNTSKLSGKNILTVEGLSEREKNIFAYAFGQTGAVQCGFCTPGMVITAKALLDKNFSPSADDVKKALKFNLCRCTGYVKIEEAIMVAATFWRDLSKPIPPSPPSKGLLGDRLPRIDVVEKVAGTGLYVDDLKFEGLLYGRALRAPCPRAFIKNIDVRRAQNLFGVVAVMVAEDIVGERFLGHLPQTQDWPALIATGEETRYVGDCLALVAATTKEIAAEALTLIDVDYEERAPLSSPQMSLAENAPHIHPGGNILKTQKLFRGNPSEVLQNSKFVVNNTFHLPFTEHAFLEPECAIATIFGDGIMLYTASQSIYDDQRECARVLGLKPEQVRVRSLLVGGGFGGKEDMSVQHHAALLSFKTKAPVKMLLS